MIYLPILHTSLLICVNHILDWITLESHLLEYEYRSWNTKEEILGLREWSIDLNSLQVERQEWIDSGRMQMLVCGFWRLKKNFWRQYECQVSECFMLCIYLWAFITFIHLTRSTDIWFITWWQMFIGDKGSSVSGEPSGITVCSWEWQVAEMKLTFFNTHVKVESRCFYCLMTICLVPVLLLYNCILCLKEIWISFPDLICAFTT